VVLRRYSRLFKRNLPAELGPARAALVFAADRCSVAWEFRDESALVLCWAASLLKENFNVDHRGIRVGAGAGEHKRVALKIFTGAGPACARFRLAA